MASRYEVEVTVSSAKDLKNINWRYGPIRPYAILWVNPDRKVTTRTCDQGDTKPEWNQKVVVPLDCPVEDATLYVDVVHYAAPEEEDTKPLIGSAKLSLRDIMDDEGIGALAPRKLKLKRPSGRPQGKLELEIMVRDLRYHGENPYPPPHVGYGDSPYYAQNKSTYPYGEQPPAYGEPARYGDPGYGAQPPAYGEPVPYGNPAYGGQPPAYGEPVPAGQGYEEVHTEEQKKKSKFGGMGTGLAVGAVAGVAGGLALGYGIHKLTEDDDDDDEKEEEEKEEEEEVAEREYEEEEEEEEEEEAHDDDDDE